MYFRNINVATRAALFFSMIVVLVLALGWVAFAEMASLRDAEKDVELNWMASIRQTALIDKSVLRLRLETLRAVTTTDKKLAQDSLVSVKLHESDLIKFVKDYEPLIASDKERDLYVAVRDSANTYENLLGTFKSLAESGANDKAIELIDTSLRPLTNTLQVQVDKLTDINDVGAAAAGVFANETYTKGVWLVLLIICTVVVLTIVLAALLIKSITNPIGEALSVAERIANSDLSKNILASGTDEAGRLLTALATMQDNLRGTIRQISNASTQLSSSAQQMMEITEHTSRGTVSQTDEVNQAATAVTEMSAAVDEVARNAEFASSESKSAQEFTRSGLDRVSQTLQAIQGLTANVTTTNDQILVLSNRAQDISKVVEVIRAIAEQTNLLALNAAIEAARAGEQGRGFAVVADEVRALAHRTQQSTQEIEQMIVAVQSDSKLAVDAISMSKEQATKSLLVAQEASASLDQISNAIAHITERNLQIATASEEQSHVARDVDRNLVNIRDASIENATGATKTASASSQMSNLAVELNVLVRKFAV